MESVVGEKQPEKAVEILLVEDNPGDVHLTLAALNRTPISNRVHVVGDGEAAIRFLRRRDGYDSAVRPDLILMDLNLPRKGGHEVLEEIRSDEELRSLPVIVLSSSELAQDVLRSYGLRANCHIAKPLGASDFDAVVQAISSFWFEVATLPVTHGN